MDNSNLEKILNSPELQSNDINIFISKAHGYMEEGSNDIALIILTEAVKKFPDSDKAFFELGYLLYELNNIDDAIVNLKRSIEIDANKNPKKYFTLAEISNPKDAIVLYETGIQLYQQKMNEPSMDGILIRRENTRDK